MGVVGDKMQVVFSGLRVPALRGVGSSLRAGGPAHAGHGSMADIGDVLKMVALRGVGLLCLYEPEAHDLTIAQVMVLSCPVR